MTDKDKDRYIEIIQHIGVWVCRLALVGGGLFCTARSNIEGASSCFGLAIGSFFLLDI